MCVLVLVSAFHNENELCDTRTSYAPLRTRLFDTNTCDFLSYYVLCISEEIVCFRAHSDTACTQHTCWSSKNLNSEPAVTEHGMLQFHEAVMVNLHIDAGSLATDRQVRVHYL